MAGLRASGGQQGAPGVDGITVEELKPLLQARWEAIREELLGGTYRPSPVRKVEIPKPGGGVRTLGIPTVLDRLIQQALYQALQGWYDSILGPELRLPSGTQRSRSTRACPRACRGRVSLGGGYGPGEVLRPGQPRHLDVAAGASDRRQTHPASDPPLLAGGDDGGWLGVATHGRHAARRPALTATVQHPAR